MIPYFFKEGVNLPNMICLKIEEFQELTWRDTLNTHPLKRDILTAKWEIKHKKRKYNYLRAMRSRLLKLAKQKNKTAIVNEWIDWSAMPEGSYGLDIHMTLPETCFSRYILSKKLLNEIWEVIIDSFQFDFDSVIDSCQTVIGTIQQIFSKENDYWVITCSDTEALEPDEEYEYQLNKEYGHPEVGFPDEYTLYYTKMFFEEDIVKCTEDWFKRIPELKDFKAILNKE